MFDRWLKCDVFRGMFSDEFAVVVSTSGGECVSAFVPSDRVEGKAEQAGRVRVRVFEETGRSWAVLPNESQTIIAVEPSELAV